MVAFRSSYKHFKEQFFRLGAGPIDPYLLVDEVGKECFPLYWTRNPRSKFTVDQRDLSVADRSEVDRLWL